MKDQSTANMVTALTKEEAAQIASSKAALVAAVLPAPLAELNDDEGPRRSGSFSVRSSRPGHIRQKSMVPSLVVDASDQVLSAAVAQPASAHYKRRTGSALEAFRFGTERLEAVSETDEEQVASLQYR